jgi:hypothetical protein
MTYAVLDSVFGIISIKEEAVEAQALFQQLREDHRQDWFGILECRRPPKHLRRSKQFYPNGQRKANGRCKNN